MKIQPEHEKELAAYHSEKQRQYFYFDQLPVALRTYFNEHGDAGMPMDQMYMLSRRVPAHVIIQQIVQFRKANQ